MSQRSERISDEFQKALSEAIRTLKDPRVHEAMVSVTRCEVTGDLRYAKAYISVFGSEQQKKDVMRGLKSAGGYLRRECDDPVVESAAAHLHQVSGADLLPTWPVDFSPGKVPEGGIGA